MSRVRMAPISIFDTTISNKTYLQVLTTSKLFKNTSMKKGTALFAQAWNNWK